MNFTEILAKLRPRAVGALAHNLASLKAKNFDRVENLKSQNRLLESQLRSKAGEYRSAQGQAKLIAAAEIEFLVREINSVAGQHKIAFANIARISSAMSKLDELAAAADSGIPASEIDKIYLATESAFSDLEMSDLASEQLSQVQYYPPKAEPVNVEASLADAPAPATLSESAKRQLADLAASTEPEYAGPETETT